MGTIMGNGVTIRGGSRAGAKIATTLNEDGTQNVFIEDKVNNVIDTTKSIFSVNYNKVLVPLVGNSIEIPKFTYTGKFGMIYDGNNNWRIKLLTSGTFTPNEPMTVDIFLVGGGGGGGYPGNNRLAGGGGGGGYTTTEKNIKLTSGKDYDVVIGAGGAAINGGTSERSGTGGTTTFDKYSAKGGLGGLCVASQATGSTYANGGSGGGGYNGAGGSDGSNGSGTYGGVGQGTTTREFGESTGDLYAGGGGAGSFGNHESDAPLCPGGAGGGGTGSRCWGISSMTYVAGTPGEPNSGGGGGGGNNYDKRTRAREGGSGIVCIRLHKGDEPSSDIPLSGDLAVGNLVTFDDKSWRVVHNEGTKWYLALSTISENTQFGSNNVYKGSTLANKCASYLNNFSANAQSFMQNVTVENVTNKVFVPTRAQVNGGFSWYNSNANRICQLNSTNSTWWTSSPNGGGAVYGVNSDGAIYNGGGPSNSHGFRPHICIDTSLSGSSDNYVLNGTYLFNANPTAPAKYPFTEIVPYKYGSSSGGTYQSIRFYQDANTKNLCMYYHYSDTSATAVYNFTTKKWLNDTYKTIIFDNQTVSKEFYTWFTSNTTKTS